MSQQSNYRKLKRWEVWTRIAKNLATIALIVSQLLSPQNGSDPAVPSAVAVSRSAEAVAR